MFGRNANVVLAAKYNHFIRGDTRHISEFLATEFTPNFIHVNRRHVKDLGNGAFILYLHHRSYGISQSSMKFLNLVILNQSPFSLSCSEYAQTVLGQSQADHFTILAWDWLSTVWPYTRCRKWAQVPTLLHRVSCTCEWIIPTPNYNTKFNITLHHRWCTVVLKVSRVRAECKAFVPCYAHIVLKRW